jgi:hypothetical protein
MPVSMNVNLRPPENSYSRGRIAAVGLKWLARGAALCLGLLWGTFFIEHLKEWYLQAPQAFPPVWVLVGMGLHLGFVVGLVAMLRWSRLGSIFTIVSTIAFIALTAVHAKPATLVLINLVPVAMLAVSSALARVAGRMDA